MMDIESLEENSSLTMLRNVSGKKLSFLGTGGNLNAVIYPKSLIQAAWVIDRLKGQDYYIIGYCSNTLISDDGTEKPVINTTKLENISVDKTTVYAEAGVSLKALSNMAKNMGLSGLEKLSGVPGSLGGAVYMNAGAYGRDIGSLVNFADILIDGKIERIVGKELGFSYRKSLIQDNGGIVLAASLNLVRSNYDDIIREEERVKTLRINSQPKERSLGSVFKANNGIPAAKYIEELKLKGHYVGGARISTVHCNFIVNSGNATTRDYITLARLIQDQVYLKFGVLLESELTYIGEADEDFRRLSHPHGLQPR